MTTRLPTVSLELFLPGTVVQYRAQEYTVSYVAISSRGIKLCLHGLDLPIWSHDRDVRSRPTYIDFDLARTATSQQEYDTKIGELNDNQNSVLL